MIKIGITGGTSREAGELLRILVNHPDVEVRSVLSHEHCGERVQNVHLGLIGETDLRFTETLDSCNLDAIFICPLPDNATDDETGIANDILTGNHTNPELRVIDLSHHHTAFSSDTNDFVFGLSELNRKPLVRGAKKASLPYPEESGAIITLFPLALRLLIKDNIKIRLIAKPGAIESSRLISTADNVTDILRNIQKSFNGHVSFEIMENNEAVGLRLQTELDTSLDYTHILESYESVYDDHNFTFMTSSPVDGKEVSGTNRCIISLRKSDSGTLLIDTVIDNNMRGGASEAVHLLNLLFGLHERTGLNLKANI